MRWKGSLLSFVVTFTVSLVLGVLFSPFKSSGPGFSKEEAAQKLGRRIKCVAALDGETNLKLDAKGKFSVIPSGSRGTIRDMEEMASGQYFIVVYWDEQELNGPSRSWFGKDYQQAGIIEE